MKRWFPVLALLLLARCGGATDAPTPEESGAVAEGGSAATTAQQAVVLADSLFDFDPTLDATATPEANAAAIVTHVRAGISTCGSVTATGATVQVDFGAGCTFANGVSASGSVTAVVSRAGTSTTVALTFAGLTVNGHALTGTATFRTTDGTTFAVDAALRSGSDAVTAMLTVVGGVGFVTASGTATVTRGGVTSNATLTSVVWRLGDCYPSAGAMTVGRGAITVTVTLSAATAGTGQVAVTQGRRSYPATLPAYGTCPSTGGSDGGRG